MPLNNGGRGEEELLEEQLSVVLTNRFKSVKGIVVRALAKTDDEIKFKDKLMQGGINCGPSSHPDFIKNYFLLTRMLEFFDRRDKYHKSGLEAPLMGGIGERKRR